MTLELKYINDNTPLDISLPKDEAEVLKNYLLRKLERLEDAKLEDSYCYSKLQSVYYKILKYLD